MDLSPGTRLASYEVVALLGAGAMGEVYRARDTTLGREVAIKLLPEAFTADEERLARFDREARLLAQLNHPGIAGIHGIETVDTGRFIVMEFVPGGTLTDRMASGPVPVKETLELARQIADALEAAHESGIVHRDLKPENVAVTPDDTVKLLDFGIGKPVGDDAERVIGTSSGMTETGVILGTPAYISPEQMRGKPVDRRADIWAFGCLLYEMLTGNKAFAGETIGEIAAAVLRGEPDWALVPPTPQPLERLIRDCLTRDPRSRLRDMGEARRTIERLIGGDTGTVAQPAPEPPVATGRQRLGRVVSLLAAVLVGAAFGWWLWGRGGLPATAVQSSPGLTVNVAEAENFRPGSVEGGGLALSPDGRYLAIAGTDADGAHALQLRDLASGDVTSLPFHEGVLGRLSSPRSLSWSPNGTALCYLLSSGLYRLDRHERRPVQLLAGDINVVDWSHDDWLLCGFADDRIVRVSVAGDEVDSLDPLEGNLRQSWISDLKMIPESDRFLVSLAHKAYDDRSGLFLGRLKSNELNRLSSDFGSFECLDQQRVALVRNDVIAVFRVDFEDGTLRALGEESAPTAGDVAVDWAEAAFTATADGHRLAYLHAEGGSDWSLCWVDRGTNELSHVEIAGSRIRGDLWRPRLSQDQERVLIDRSTLHTKGDIWCLDLVQGTERQLTDDASDESAPMWSGDESEIYFWRGGAGVWRRTASGADTAQPLFDTPFSVVPHALAPDGKGLLIDVNLDSEGDQGDIMLVDLSSGSARPWLKTNATEWNPRVSPDGRWVAFASDESGTTEIYVASFSDPQGRSPVTRSGGYYPRWARDTNELFYVSKGKIMVRSIESSGGDSPTFTDATLVVGMPWYRVSQRGYDVTPDGRRVLMPIPPRTKIRIVDGWLSRSR